MSSGKRGWKIQEFTAHAAKVNGVHIGRKSGRVLATGGDDRKVNVWAIGKPNALLSLSGHSSNVECVSFDASEEHVVAGSSGGTLKLWDLESGKVTRTLLGHKANAMAVDFHPYGEFLASGSLDTNLKVWDIRRKGCIQTYKGHSGGVNAVSFSPDGRWVVSAGEDGTARLWDLTAGKLLTEFIAHSGPVTCLAFHPHEFLLATGSEDRTARFWDLETFEPVAGSEVDATRLRSIAFSPDGQGLLSASQDSLKVWGWEPKRSYDAVPMSWGAVADMAPSKDQLMTASVSGTQVSIWSVNLARLQPWSRQSTGSNGGVSIIVDEKTAARVRRQEADEAAAKAKFESSWGARRPASSQDDYMVRDSANPESLKSPSENNPPPKVQPRSNGATPRKPPAPSKPAEASPAIVKRQTQASQAPAPTPTPTSAPPPPPASTTHQQPSSQPQQPQPQQPQQPSSAPVQQHPHPHQQQQQQQQQPKQVSNPAPPAQVHEEVGNPFEKRPKIPASHASAAASVEPAAANRAAASKDAFIPANRSAPVGLEPSDFNVGAKASGRSRPLTDDGVIKEVMAAHSTMCTILSARTANLGTLAKLYARGDIGGAMTSLNKMKDASTAKDFFDVVNAKPNVYTLELVAPACGLLTELLGSRFEDYILTALTTTHHFVKAFGPMIKSTLSFKTSGVDLSREERMAKCKSAEEGLEAVYALLTPLTTRGGRLGSKAREVHASFQLVRRHN